MAECRKRFAGSRPLNPLAVPMTRGKQRELHVSTPGVDRRMTQLGIFEAAPVARDPFLYTPGPKAAELDEIVVDSFAGGGGASEGIRLALGYSPHVCINHKLSAIAMHT